MGEPLIYCGLKLAWGALLQLLIKDVTLKEEAWGCAICWLERITGALDFHNRKEGSGLNMMGRSCIADGGFYI